MAAVKPSKRPSGFNAGDLIDGVETLAGWLKDAKVKDPAAKQRVREILGGMRDGAVELRELLVAGEAMDDPSRRHVRILERGPRYTAKVIDPC